MKTVILFGAGQIGQAVSRLLSADLKQLCFIDNFEKKWGTRVSGLPVCSPEILKEAAPDYVCLCVLDSVRQAKMKELLRDRLNYQGELLTPNELQLFDSRCGVMRLLAEQIREYEIPGDTAELGVFRGVFSGVIQAALPDRPIHLFDTFEGFSELDTSSESAFGFSRAKPGDFSDTSVQEVLKALPFPERAIIHKGWFPDTFSEVTDTGFSFVSLDADLYEPTKAALPLFYDRLSPGGVLMIHDVYSTQFAGCKKAVTEFCLETGILPVPVSDLHGSAVLRKPL